MSRPILGRDDQPTFGIFCSLPSPGLVEMIGWAGFDFVVLDTEHTLTRGLDVEHLLRAADAARLPALVRVPVAEPWAIAPVLDAGARGVVVARTRSRADAAAAVRASHYQPRGERGLDAGRATRYGQDDLAVYVASAHRHVHVVAMIEDLDGLRAIDDIVRTPGLDAVLEGAADLSQALGAPWQTTHPDVRGALETVQRACAHADVPFLAIPRRPEDLTRWYQAGVRTFVLGEARGVAFRALRDHLNQARGTGHD